MGNYYKHQPEIPTYDIPEELKEYGEGACFMIVREEPGDPNSPLKFIHAFNAATEEYESPKDTFYPTRREATLATIDAALDYSIKEKK